MRSATAPWLAGLVLACASLPAAAAPPIRTLSEQEVWDLMAGAAIDGTRGRVKPVAPFIEGAVRKLLAEGKPFRLVALEDVPDDWTLAEAGGRIGGGGAWTHVAERMKQQGTPVVPATDGMRLAMEALERQTGHRLDAVVRAEAAEATAAAFQAAMAAGLPVVDACPTGRAVPELAQSVAYVSGVAATPAALVSLWGDVVLVEKAIDAARLEDIGRSMAVGSAGSVITASTVMAGRDAKRALIPGVLSREILMGRSVREARARGADPVAALLGVTHGLYLFRGHVTRAVNREDRGFDWWDVEIEGSGTFQGHRYRLWVKNENIVGWFDDRPDAMSPDLIAPLDPATGEAMLSPKLGGYDPGADVVLVGFPAPAMWRTPAAIDLLGPRHFGFDFDYVPLEQLHVNRPR